MKLFVTGGTGFIGSHFIQLATARGHSVTATRRPGSRPRIPLAPEPCWISKNLAELEASDFIGMDALLHFAAVGVNPSLSDWETCFRTNVVDSLRCWRMAASSGMTRFIICGSCFEYGASGESMAAISIDCPLQPTGPYHASKAAATMAALGLARTENLQLTILRPFHVYGEGEEPHRFWPSLRDAALAGRDFPMTLGEQVRDFIPVEDVAQTFLRFLEKEPHAPGMPEIYNVGSGRPQTLREFAEFWWQKWGATGKLKFGEIPYREGEVMRYAPEILK